MRINGLGLSLIGALALVICGCDERHNEQDSPQTLTIFHAGSLSVPFREISQLFQQDHPKLVIRSEAAGSRDTARKVSDLGRNCDILGSADWTVVKNLLMPEHAHFNIRFATNEMGIAYTLGSKMAQEMGSDSWPDILLHEDVIFGRSDPNSDPCGYRTVMLFELAEKHLAMPDLAWKLQTKHGKRYIRPKETDLLALLEAGVIDYMFIYRSVALQHKLEFLVLPDEMNLKTPNFADLYATSSAKVTGKGPGQFITRLGSPIVYSVTIPLSAQNAKLAIAWVELLLSQSGQAVMRRHGQTPIVPATTAQFDALPNYLKAHCKPLRTP